MLISIIVTVKNEEKRIPLLLDSLIIQEKPFEVIVVDAYSTDNTRNIVRKYSKKYSFIKLYKKRGNRSVGRNYGVKKARGKYIAFIDGDCIAHPFWLKEIRKAFKKRCDVVAGKTIQIGYGPFEKLERVELDYKGIDVTFPSCNLGYKKSLFYEIGGFDPEFITAEDIDLNIRAKDKNAVFCYNENAIVLHLTRDTLFSFFKQAFWNGYGRRQIIKKHGKRMWRYYKPSKMIKTNLSIIGILRLFFGLLGYFYGTIKC